MLDTPRRAGNAERIWQAASGPHRQGQLDDPWTGKGGVPYSVSAVGGVMNSTLPDGSLY
jgi:hypothetical protein